MADRHPAQSNREETFFWSSVADTKLLLSLAVGSLLLTGAPPQSGTTPLRMAVKVLNSARLPARFVLADGVVATIRPIEKVGQITRPSRQPWSYPMPQRGAPTSV